MRIDAEAAAWVARRDAGLTEPEQSAFEGWLTADQRHAKSWTRLTAAWAALDRPRETGGAEAMIHGLARRASRRRHGRLALAGVGVASVMLFTAWWHELTVAPGSDPTMAIAAGPRMLPDGSLVELNTDAEITEDFSTGLRQVHLLKGEAHFQVRPEAGRPFVVKAGHVEVRALGTAFAVRLDPEAVEVMVTEGRVTVDNPTVTPNSMPAAEVAAGHKVVVPTERTHAAVEVTSMTEQDFNERLGWRGQRLEFSGVPLSEAILQFNTRNRVRLIIADPAIARLQISGIFRGDNIEGFVRLLEGSFGVRVERRAEKEIVLGRQP